MKEKFLLAAILLLFITSTSYSQYLNYNKTTNFQSLKENKLIFKNKALTSTGASMGFNAGVASIESEVGFAIGAFAELKARDFSFVPQANYWNAKKQTNFELAGLARFYLSQKGIYPYIDGGLGINFYNSEKNNFSKLSILAGGGIELANLGTSFNLLIDGKYKLIVNNQANISCFIFTAGIKFPLK